MHLGSEQGVRMSAVPWPVSPTDTVFSRAAACGHRAYGSAALGIDRHRRSAGDARDITAPLVFGISVTLSVADCVISCGFHRRLNYRRAAHAEREVEAFLVCAAGLD
jgi:hypothetical protein